MNKQPKNKTKAIIITTIAIILIILILPSNFNAIGIRNTQFGNNFGNGYDVPRPSLSLDPDDNEDCNPSSYIYVTNTGDEEKDDAEGVTLEITVVKGNQYVDYIEYDGYIGRIENDESILFNYIINTTSEWDSFPDEEIKIKITVTNEVYWPEHNICRYAHYTLIHC
jgi:hypothetical protein